MLPVTMHVEYWPKAGKEAELQALVEKHWPTLRELDLATETPAQVYRARDEKGDRTFFVEIFAWKDENASDVAHQTPEVMALWEPMGPILDELKLSQIEPIGRR